MDCRQEYNDGMNVSMQILQPDWKKDEGKAVPTVNITKWMNGAMTQRPIVQPISSTGMHRWQRGGTFGHERILLLSEMVSD